MSQTTFLGYRCSRPFQYCQTYLWNVYQAIHMLCFDQANSEAAFQILPCLARTITSPLLVLLQATAVSQGILCVFFVDALHAIINAIFNKEYHVQMGRWNTKSGHWWLGTAIVGECKSPGMKHFINVMVEVLEKHQHHAVGFTRDRFHFQESGTSASAIDKLRACDGYLTVDCPDAVVMFMCCCCNWREVRPLPVHCSGNVLGRCSR